MAEGSFLIKSSGSFNFQLKQKKNFNLMKDILSIFNPNLNISINKGKYVQITLCSIKDIHNVINYFSAKDIPAPLRNAGGRVYLCTRGLRPLG